MEEKGHHRLVLLLVPRKLGLRPLRRDSAKLVLTPLNGHNEVNSGHAEETWKRTQTEAPLQGHRG